MKNTPNKAFLSARGSAKARGISFEFTYAEWVGWWEYHLGPNWLQKRGRGKYQYQMCRFMDTGPYAASNVRCATAFANQAEFRVTRLQRKLAASQLPTNDCSLSSGAGVLPDSTPWDPYW